MLMRCLSVTRVLAHRATIGILIFRQLTTSRCSAHSEGQNVFYSPWSGSVPATDPLRLVQPAVNCILCNDLRVMTDAISYRAWF